MLFKKFFFFSFTMMLIFLMNLHNFYSFYSLNINYFFLMEMKNFNFSFLIDYSSIIFIFMVCMVTSLVSLYSEFYLEKYNNKKFFFLMSSFFFSMIMLSSSKSILNLMLGWDFLGLTSICLIMFYPNKLTLNNSIFTMFFNRLGDVVLIMLISIFIFNYSSFFFFNKKYNFFILMLLISMCSFTKSAQFPLSSWLPAAMSAPTPISAMVHSSTLVTAGIFIVYKSIFYMYSLNLLNFYCMVSICTFLIGGFMALIELDFKKVVAFSTMSQISLILIFCFMNMPNIALTHMLFHAFFKTLIFCCAGTMFVYNFSDQFSKFMKNYNKLFSSLFFLSIYSMTGLAFCSSFFTKDLVLEYSCENSDIWFEMIILGSVLTLLYSSKMLFSLISWNNETKMFFTKKSFFFFMIFFSIFSMYPMKMFMESLFFPFHPQISILDLLLMLLIFSIYIYLETNKINLNKISLYVSMNIFFMKFYTFSSWKSIFIKWNLFNLLLNEETFFKPSHFNILEKLNMKKINLKNNIFPLFLILTIVMLLIF